MTVPALDICLVKPSLDPFPAKAFSLASSLTETGLPCRLLVEEDDGPPYGGDWVSRVANLRTALLSRVRAPFWLALSPAVSPAPDTIREALAWLTAREKHAGVGIWARGGAPPFLGHVTLRCALIRTAATAGRRFKVAPEEDPSARNCECYLFQRELLRDGWRLAHHPTLCIDPPAKDRPRPCP